MKTISQLYQAITRLRRKHSPKLFSPLHHLAFHWTICKIRLGRTSSGVVRTSNGPGWIRTNVGLRQRVYSPLPLATRAPTLSNRKI